MRLVFSDPLYVNAFTNLFEAWASTYTNQRGKLPANLLIWIPIRLTSMSYQNHILYLKHSPPLFFEHMVHIFKFPFSWQILNIKKWCRHVRPVLVPARVLRRRLSRRPHYRRSMWHTRWMCLPFINRLCLFGTCVTSCLHNTRAALFGNKCRRTRSSKWANNCTRPWKRFPHNPKCKKSVNYFIRPISWFFQEPVVCRHKQSGWRVLHPIFYRLCTKCTDCSSLCEISYQKCLTLETIIHQ